MAKNSETANSEQDTLLKVRIDKWLWAARFFKTRSIAKSAIEGGKVHFDGKRVKTSKYVSVGMELTIRQGSAFAGNEKQVIVTALSDKRGTATDASRLYEETIESQARRQSYTEQRKLANLARPDHRPNKKERRQLKDFHTSTQNNLNTNDFTSDDEGY